MSAVDERSGVGYRAGAVLADRMSAPRGGRDSGGWAGLFVGVGDASHRAIRPGGCASI